MVVDLKARDALAPAAAELEMAQPLQPPVAGSLPAFMLAWLPVILLPAAVLALPAWHASRWVGDNTVETTFDGREVIGYTASFCCVAAAAESWALKRWLPHAWRWFALAMLGMVGSAFLAALMANSGIEAGPLFNSLYLLADSLYPRSATAGAPTPTAGSLFGFVLGTAQSFATSFGWPRRLCWIAFSAAAGALAFAAVEPAHSMFARELVGRISPDTFIVGHAFINGAGLFSSLAWALYALMTGLAMFALLVCGRRAHRESIAARFD